MVVRRARLTSHRCELPTRDVEHCKVASITRERRVKALAVPHIRLSVSVKHCPRNRASDEVRISASKDISAHDKQGEVETYERWVKTDPCDP